jgi:hypothetical protein
MYIYASQAEPDLIAPAEPFFHDEPRKILRRIKFLNGIGEVIISISSRKNTGYKR